jgi:ankyrin repeat protein
MCLLNHRVILRASLAALLAVGCTHAANHSVFNPHPDPTRTADGSWLLHDKDRPWPPPATPKPVSELEKDSKPPTGAKVLFDGSNLDEWNQPRPWILENETLRVRPINLSLVSKESFGSCHLHVEWRTPPGNPHKTGQNRGNSGIFLMSTYEIQILDNFENKTYADGMAGALYGVRPPDANVLRPPGEWQFYDIWFARPIFDDKGNLKSPATATVMVNGVIVQKDTPFEGPSSHKKRLPYRRHADALPLQLQNHNEIVEFRNIWIQPLPDHAGTQTSASTACKTIDEAIARGNVAEVRRFLKEAASHATAGANPRLTPIQQAILRNQTEITELLVKAGADVNAADSSARTPLHLAVERRNPQTITLLLAHKADPSRRDKVGWTPLHHAASKDNIEVVRALLDGGADPKLLSECGGTPLHEAAASGSVEIITLLLKRGVNPTVISKTGLTALTIAEQRNDAPVIALFKSAINEKH